MFLLNKDKIVAEIEVINMPGAPLYRIKSVYDALPYGLQGTGIDLNAWIENRKASKHNRHLSILMEQCGCGTTDGYLQMTHSATLNDTFWIKNDGENVSWKDVSLYRNEFNDVVSRLAFEGGGLYGIKFSSTSPELTTEGSFRKCWKRENGKIFLYKRGRDEMANGGLEPFSEVLASEVASVLCDSSVRYLLSSIHKKVASKCELFTSEDIGYVPYGAMMGANKQSLHGIMSFIARQGIGEQAFRRMVVLDALILNTDRHLGNFGFLVDNDTQKIIGLAPVFDFNLSLMPYLSTSEIKNFGLRAVEYTPSIGEDFIASAKQLITPEIRSDLINMHGFKFAMRDYEKFPRERISALENIINTNISAILGKEKTRLIDVYPHVISKEEMIDKELDEAYSIGDTLAYDLGLIYDFDAYKTADGKVELVIQKESDDLIRCVLYDGLKNHKFIKGGVELKYDGPNAEAMKAEEKYKEVLRAVRGERLKREKENREQKEIARS